MNPRILRRLAAPALVAALAGAAAGAQAQTVVRLPERDRPLQGRPTPVFSIGTDEGQSWEMFSNVSQVMFDAADNLYVLDRSNSRVLKFDRNGRFVRQFGARGDGPGEFQAPRGIALTGDGSLAVGDAMKSNVTLFAPDGTVRRSVALEREWGRLGSELRAHPSGALVANLRAQLPSDGGPQRPAIQNIAVVPVSGNGFRRLMEMPDPAAPRVSQQGNARRVMVRPPAFAPNTLWDVLPNGSIVVSHEPRYRIKVTDANGRVAGVITRHFPVRTPTERDKERAREQLRELIESGRALRIVSGGGGGRGEGGPPPRSVDRMLDEMEYADTMRQVQNLRLAPSGKIWVERTPDVFGDDPGPIDLITFQGRYLGTITGLRVPDAISASSRAAWIERDENDVERVVVRTLPQEWR